jgi:hypothetical protein
MSMATAVGSYVTTTILKARTKIPDTTDDALLASICDQVNQFIEGTTGRILAPVASAVRLFDGDGTPCLRVRQGVRAVSLLECAYYTGGPYSTVPATDYFLRPTTDALAPAEPYTEIVLSDVPTGGFAVFPAGYNTVRVTATWGPAAIPDDIAEVAVVIATRAWYAREAGQADIVGTTEMGQPIVSRFVSGRDRDTLRRYTLADMLA